MQALGPRLILVSRLGVVVWSLVMGVAMTVVQAANINISWLINSIGIFCGGAVPPLIFVMTWRGCTGPAATAGQCCTLPPLAHSLLLEMAPADWCLLSKCMLWTSQKNSQLACCLVWWRTVRYYPL